MKGGELVVCYLECVRRHERMPNAGWLRQRLDDYGDELYRRMLCGSLGDVLCGLLTHQYPGPWGSPTCTCELPSVEEGGWGQPVGA